MNSTSSEIEKLIPVKHVRGGATGGRHACPNCGNMISGRYDFCTTVSFGREFSVCADAYERFWNRVNTRAAQSVKSLASR